jgi:hypothetical protein
MVKTSDANPLVDARALRQNRAPGDCTRRRTRYDPECGRLLARNDALVRNDANVNARRPLSLFNPVCSTKSVPISEFGKPTKHDSQSHETLFSLSHAFQCNTHRPDST